MGTIGRTQRRKLSNRLQNNFERDRTDTFLVKAVNLGEIKYIHLSKIGSDDWMVDYVNIYDPWLEKYLFAIGGEKIGTDGLRIEAQLCS